MKYKKITHRKAMEILSETNEDLFIIIGDEYISFTLDYDWQIEFEKKIDVKLLMGDEYYRSGKTWGTGFLELYRYDVYRKE